MLATQTTAFASTDSLFVQDFAEQRAQFCFTQGPSLHFVPSVKAVVFVLQNAFLCFLTSDSLFTDPPWEQIFVSNECLQWLNTSKSDGMFCRDVTRVLWDATELVDRSVTWAPSNRVKNAPTRRALTPKKLEAACGA